MMRRLGAAVAVLLAALSVGMTPVAAEGNATDAETSRGRPNLKVSGLSSDPATGAAGQPLRISLKIANVGGITAGASRASITLVPDSSGASYTTKIKLSSQEVAKLRKGRSILIDALVTLPDHAYPAGYKLKACADSKKSVKETSERDNCRAVSLEVVGTEPDGLTLIEDDVARGRLTQIQGIEYRAYRIFGLPEIPARYVSVSSGASRDDVQALDLVKERWEDLPASARALLRPFLIPSFLEEIPVEISARRARQGGGAAGNPLPCVTTGSSAQYRVDANWDFFAGDGVNFWFEEQNRAAAEPVAEALNNALPAIKAKLEPIYGNVIRDGGTNEACGGPDEQFDVVFDDSLGQRGLAGTTQSPSLGSCHSFMSINTGASAADISSFAHELFHVGQNSKYCTNKTNKPFDEATATWFEDHVYPDVNEEVIQFDNTWTGLDADYRSFAFFVTYARLHGNDAVVDLVKSLEPGDDGENGFAIDARLPGGLAEHWPHYALAQMNRPPADLLNQWEGMAAPGLSWPVLMDSQEDGTALYPQDSPSFSHREATFSNAKSVTLRAPSRTDLSAQVIAVVDGVPEEPRMVRGTTKICAEGDERIDAVYMTLATATGPLAPEPGLLDHVQINGSEDGCGASRYSGHITYTSEEDFYYDSGSWTDTYTTSVQAELDIVLVAGRDGHLSGGVMGNHGSTASVTLASSGASWHSRGWVDCTYSYSESGAGSAPPFAPPSWDTYNLTDEGFHNPDDPYGGYFYFHVPITIDHDGTNEGTECSPFRNTDGTHEGKLGFACLVSSFEKNAQGKVVEFDFTGTRSNSTGRLTQTCEGTLVAE